VSGQLHDPAASPTEKEPPIPIGWEAGWATVPLWTTWRRGKSRPYWGSNSDCLAVQPIASRYTDCAIRASITDNKFTLWHFIIIITSYAELLKNINWLLMILEKHVVTSVDSISVLWWPRDDLPCSLSLKSGLNIVWAQESWNSMSSAAATHFIGWATEAHHLQSTVWCVTNLSCTYIDVTFNSPLNECCVDCGGHACIWRWWAARLSFVALVFLAGHLTCLASSDILGLCFKHCITGKSFLQIGDRRHHYGLKAKEENHLTFSYFYSCPLYNSLGYPLFSMAISLPVESKSLLPNMYVE
jgi:hypothetical protein